MVNILFIFIFMIMLALPYYLLLVIGKAFSKIFKCNKWIAWLFPLAGLTATSVWFKTSFSEFENICSNEPSVVVEKRINGWPFKYDVIKEKNTYIRDWSNDSFGIGGKNDPINHGDWVRDCQHRENVNDDYKCDKSLMKHVNVHVYSVYPIHRWWHPPIYREKIEVRDRETNDLLVSASDIIFGGGLVGKIMRLFGGDQDFEKLSCGYASRQVGPWRPTLSTRDRYKEYMDADISLIYASFNMHKGLVEK